MLIHVTQRHIDAGCRMSVGNCPIALAIIEQTTLDDVCITGLRVLIGDLSSTEWIELPHACLLFVHKFDGGFSVAPFSFELKGVQPRETRRSLAAPDLLHDLNSMRADASRPVGSEEVFEDAAA